MFYDIRLLFLIFISILLNSDFNQIYAQDIEEKEFKIIEVKQFYDTQGAIIPALYETYFAAPKGFLRFDPSVEEVIEAEKILNYILSMILGFSDYYTPIMNKTTRSYYRQYSGYTNESGDKIIRIIMYDFQSVKSNSKYPDKLRKRILISMQPEKEYIYRYFNINLKTREIEKHSNILIDDFWFLGKYRDGVPIE